MTLRLNYDDRALGVKRDSYQVYSQGSHLTVPAAKTVSFSVSAGSGAALSCLPFSAL